jgi:hypothetical protein
MNAKDIYSQLTKRPKFMKAKLYQDLAAIFRQDAGLKGMKMAQYYQ